MTNKPVTRALDEVINYYAETHKTEEDGGGDIVERAENELEGLKNDEAKPQEFKVALEAYKGVLRINMMDFLDNLSEETREELLSDGGWNVMITREMVEDIKHKFSSKNFDGRIYEMRQALLQSEVLPQIMRQFIQALVDHCLWERKCEDRYRDAFYNIQNSTFCDQNEELKEFVQAQDVKTPDVVRCDSRDVQAFVENFFTVTGLVPMIDETLQMELEMLTERDPEVATRAIERERERKNLRRNW